MISKKLYIDCVNSIIKYNKLSSELYEKTHGVVDLIELKELNDMQFMFEQLLEYCTKDYKYEFGTNLSYFLYDCEAGEASTCKDGSSKIKDSDGKDIPMKTIDNLWDYLKSENPDIEDEK